MKNPKLLEPWSYPPMDLRGSESAINLSASFSSPLDKSWLPSLSFRGQSAKTSQSRPVRALASERETQQPLTIVGRRLLPLLSPPDAAAGGGPVVTVLLLVFHQNLPQQLLRRGQQLPGLQLNTHRSDS